MEVVPEGWIPPTEDKRGDVAVLKMTAGRPAGATAVPLRRPHQTEDRHFAVQGFPDGTLIGATGVIRTQLTIGQEWTQLEDDKQAGRAVTEGFSGAPIWDTTLKAVVGMAIAKDARAPAAKIAAILPVTLLASYWLGVITGRWCWPDSVGEPPLPATVSSSTRSCSLGLWSTTRPEFCCS